MNKEPGAEERFKEINEAYRVLGDPDTRRQYDELGHADFENSGFGGFGDFGDFGFGFEDLGDIFADMFFGRSSTRRDRRPRKGPISGWISPSSLRKLRLVLRRLWRFSGPKSVPTATATRLNRVLL